MSKLKMVALASTLASAALLWESWFAVGDDGANLVQDPSFEMPQDRDQFGRVFAKWGGWKYEGDCEFRVGQLAHSGKHSCLLVGSSTPKIRVSQKSDLKPGRYKITAYIRGLDIGTGAWNATTEFMFNDKYMQLKKNGTFGWTRLVYVADVTDEKKAGPSFGLMAPGYFWIDDVSLVKVGQDVPLTEIPLLGAEESPVAPPAVLSKTGAIRCTECGYKNMPAWKSCYACGSPLEAKQASVAVVPAVKPIATFEGRSPFSGGTVVEEHATEGRKALRLDKSYASMDQLQNWLGYDYLKADLYTDAADPVQLDVEIRDTATRDYWTRVNYTTVVPPGQSTLTIPIKQLYVGQKSRPGRPLILSGITRLVFNIGETPPAPLFIDNVRLDRDDSLEQRVFDGLWAFSFGPSTGPLMEGFTRITPTTIYNRGRGYGLKDARIWRASDALQPDPLYQDFICIESGGLAVDVPNGKYRVFVNIDSPSGYWGEYQIYRNRQILAQGRPVVTETMDFESFQRKYYRFWNVEDLPSDNTFDKYQKAYFHEQVFDVEVTDGQLNLSFMGKNWGCCVSATVIFPVAKAAQGEKFLKFVEAKRRFCFDNYFKRVLHRPTGDPLRPSAEDRQRGYVLFERDLMEDVYYNDTPRREEIGRPLRGDAFAGEYGPLTLAVLPVEDLGRVTVTPGSLIGPSDAIPADAIDVGYVSYRISRVTMEGSVYTIAPRLLMPGRMVNMPRAITRRLWLTVKTPAGARPGLYKGRIVVRPEHGAAAEVPVEFRVRAGTLDPLDVPAGPFGYSIRTPWPSDDPAAKEHDRQMCLRSMRKLREYGFTTCSGIPSIAFRGFKIGKPVLDFAAADRQMQLAKELGFLAVVTYGGGVSGFDAYSQDLAAMKAAGFSDYAHFIRAIYGAIQRHADANGWLPVFYNLADEPIGETLPRSIENAEAYQRAFPKGPPYFTGASSFTGKDRTNPRFRLGKALTVVDWNLHDEDSVSLIREAGRDWAFYNGGNRWTYGDYMYKAVKQFGMTFRLAWHWNVVAGDPYYALDCREDDYAWCNSSPDGQLVPSIEFERLREGLGDYRRLLTLEGLARQKAGAAAAKAAQELVDGRMAAFKLGQREHDSLFPKSDWNEFRSKVSDAIEALRR